MQYQDSYSKIDCKLEKSCPYSIQVSLILSPGLQKQGTATESTTQMPKTLWPSKIGLLAYQASTIKISDIHLNIKS